MPDERTLVAAPPRTEESVFFLHVMKTAGSTLFWELRRQYTGEQLWPDPELDFRYDGPKLDVRHHLSVPYLASLPEERRRRILLYSGHLPFVARETMGDVATVTILRDPIERTISLLRQFRRTAPQVQDPSRRPPLADASLEEVYAHPDVFEPLVHNHQTKLFSMRMSDDPQGYLDVLDIDEGRLEVAKENLAAAEVVGLTERYPDFLDAVETRFGWTVTRAARHNETPRDAMQPVSGALRRRIAIDNAIDVDFYEYARQLVETRKRRRTSA